MLAHLRERAGAGGVLSYRDFTAAALYAPGLGYYARVGVERVGRRGSADFYTASSLQGGVFGRLVRAAAEKLLEPGRLRDYAAVEIGAEPGMSVLEKEAEHFASVETRRLGEPLEPRGKSVVFANELLDAQPFHRLVYRRGEWRELGVRVDGRELKEVELAEMTAAAQGLRGDLPAESAEGYLLDISLDAEALLRDLAAQPWAGLLILADYGYDWNDLARERPAGTARAYHRQEASRDLLARPGEQDLTCQVCWDRLERVLRAGGFAEVTVERQEGFFLHHAQAVVSEILSATAGRFAPARQTLMELVHPAHLGHKFQVLHGRRE
jgi:SAM-dependent MidA family methyltransferase